MTTPATSLVGKGSIQGILSISTVSRRVMVMNKKKMQFRDTSEDWKFDNGGLGSILKRRYHRLILQGSGAPKVIPFHQKIGEFRVQHYAAVESSPVKDDQEESIILFPYRDADSGSDQQFEDILEILKFEIRKDQDISYEPNPSPFPIPAHRKIESWSFRRDKIFDDPKIDRFIDAKENTFPSRTSHYRSDVHGWNNLIAKPINSFKQRIKRALHRKGSTTEFDLRGITKGPPEVDFNVRLGFNDSSVEERFTKSALLESLEKYARLLECVCVADSKLQQSRSLKLRDEDRGVWRGQGAEFRRKTASLSDLESSGLFLRDKEFSNGDKEEMNRASFDEVVTSLNSCSNEEEELNPPSEHDAVKEKESTEVESSELNHDEESSKFQTKEGPEQEREEMQNLLQSYYTLDKTIESNFNFVRDLLDLPGFLRDGYNGTFFSSKDSVSFESSDQRLLFDLVNDCLAEIYDTRFNCFDHWTRPLPKGEHVLEDVWGRVSWSMKLSLERGLSYTDIVAVDVTEEAQSWVKIWAKIERTVFEVADLIFDDLVDEALCCFEGAFDD